MKKVEENKEKGKHTYTTTSQNIHLNILYIFFILLNFNKTTFTKKIVLFEYIISNFNFKYKNNV
jgi:hypothetical protein